MRGQKKLIKSMIPNALLDFLKLWRSSRSLVERECPCCGYIGNFRWYGRRDARCPSCGSLERHRLMTLALKRQEITFPFDLASARMLHFAPERIITKLFSDKVGSYTTADLFRDDVDKKLNIEDIAEDSESYDIALVSHVLEHVDDKRATGEIFRILKKGGVLIAMVPIIEGWSRSYENESIVSDKDRTIHFGQRDHVRMYGADFASRVEESGLKLVQEVVAFGDDCVRYGLLRGQKVFVFQKSAT